MTQFILDHTSMGSVKFYLMHKIFCEDKIMGNY